MRISHSQAARALKSLLAVVFLTSGVAGCKPYTAAQSVHPIPDRTSPPDGRSTQGPGAASPAGQLILSIEENGNAHLFAYSPSTAGLTRLTWGPWSDITPALSPDGKAVAFASNRSGYWDIYKVDLQTATVSQLTNTPAYDASPTWSPDQAWMAYETYNDGHLDIAIRSLTDAAQSPMLLTDDAPADHSPSWSPNGRQIAFVSNRTGDSEIWLADLNTAQNRFTNLSHTPQAAESHPVWSPDGARLAWAATAPSLGYAGTYVWDSASPDHSAVWIGSGDWPAWNADGTQITTVVHAPNQDLLAAYTLTGLPVLLPEPLAGRVRGLLWQKQAWPNPLPHAFAQAAGQTPEELSVAPITQISGVPSKRWYVVPLQNVQAPSAKLHALVAQSFADLRQRVIREAGWDALASLENAFVPLTTALDPGLAEDWLYTGRAFAINSLMANAGWMSIAREDVGAQTYWRLYLRTQNQDGSQGAPIADPPWDLNARYQLDPQAYEAGGSFVAVPPGYWIDFTALAAAYGWQRLPALPDWRTYFAGARSTEFAMMGGLDWYSAMLELYPAAALITPTIVLPPTATPSRTPIPTETAEPTRTPLATATASLSPTPAPPTNSPTPAPPTNTPLPTLPPPTPPTIIPTFPSPTP
jgi:TolB protein